ncbi:pirin family protein [Pedobacter arcticus]|uniref:pirin family protein n=1 Tax=Pedobacter arcticus TaxID=752140 RepID=UPI0002ED91F1|nr:pirin family protein [Pedobacter arcticus]
MKTIFHPAKERGFNSLGWLKSHHSFSFGQYSDPKKMNFGLLRVLNDDHVEQSMGFGAHGHKNMEIISIPLHGALRHKDSTGRDEIIKSGDVQIMSAGSGIQHSEYNASKEEPVDFLQIWVFPKAEDIEPRYEQKSFSDKDKVNKFLTVVSPNEDDGAIFINQDAWFSLSHINTGVALDYKLRSKENGVYVFVIDGSIEISNQTLEKRDALGVYDTENFAIKASTDAKVLLIEVPMA